MNLQTWSAQDEADHKERLSKRLNEKTKTLEHITCPEESKILQFQIDALRDRIGEMLNGW